MQRCNATEIHLHCQRNKDDCWERRTSEFCSWVFLSYLPAIDSCHALAACLHCVQTRSFYCLSVHHHLLHSHRHPTFHPRESFCGTLNSSWELWMRFFHRVTLNWFIRDSPIGQLHLLLAHCPFQDLYDRMHCLGDSLNSWHFSCIRGNIIKTVRDV